MEKILYIIAGGNGSGKSTLATDEKLYNMFTKDFIS